MLVGFSEQTVFSCSLKHASLIVKTNHSNYEKWPINRQARTVRYQHAYSSNKYSIVSIMKHNSYAEHHCVDCNLCFML